MIGRKIIVKFCGLVDPVIESLQLNGTFNYIDGYTSNVLVKRDEIHQDGFVVTYFWIDGDGPDLKIVTVQELLQAALEHTHIALSNPDRSPY